MRIILIESMCDQLQLSLNLNVKTIPVDNVFNSTTRCLPLWTESNNQLDKMTSIRYEIMGLFSLINTFQREVSNFAPIRKLRSRSNGFVSLISFARLCFDEQFQAWISEIRLKAGLEEIKVTVHINLQRPRPSVTRSWSM